VFAKFRDKPIEELQRDPQALTFGRNVFANNCAVCHGSDARGAKGYPNLTDGDWLFGGEPDTIETTIMGGRVGMMPPFAPALGGDENVKAVVAYVRSLSGNGRDSDDAKLVELGKAKFDTICVACHGMDAKGNKVIGAPNLTDDVWLFGGTADDIEFGLRNGRSGRMPAHGDILGPEKVHLLATYVYSLSHPELVAR